MGIYMKYGNIQGDATQKGFEGWINLTHFDWGLERKFSDDQVGRAFNREAAQAQMYQCTVKKEVDSSSGQIMQTATTEFKGQPCDIAFVRTGNPGDTYLQFTLTDALFAKLDVATQGPAPRPIETITIDFTEVSITCFSLNELNASAEKIVVTYNAATGIGS
jgi:type VI secretion system secreted protein Hcp